MNVIIADDEAPARTRLRSLLRAIPDAALVAECKNGHEVVAAIRAHKPALLLLDVQMPELDGFGALRALTPQERPHSVIFITAYDRYAIEAFEVNAVDYLLKPFTSERFEEAIGRARSRLVSASATDNIESMLRAIAERPARNDRLAIRTKDAVQFVRIPEIDWLQADGNYTSLHLGTLTLSIRETFSDLEERLNPFGFVRVHRSIIVNSDRILRVEPWSHGEYLIVLRNGAKVNTGRGYTDNVRALFG